MTITSTNSKKRDAVENVEASIDNRKLRRDKKISRDKSLYQLLFSQCTLPLNAPFIELSFIPRVMKPINVHYHFMAYKAAVIIAIVVPRAATMSWDLKKKKRKETSAESGGSDGTTTAARLHSAERGGGRRGDRGQWLVQGLRFELKFDAAPQRRRFLPTT